MIIQNKYYSENVCVPRKEVSDFLDAPLTSLMANSYTKSAELQALFNKAKDDPEYKILFYFFATTDLKGDGIDSTVKRFNAQNHEVSCFINALYYDITQLHELYYGKNYKEEKTFTHKLGTINRGTFASLRVDYGIEGYEGYYIATPVSQIYKMLVDAEAKEYPLFDENIREYLGENAVNKGIIDTLKSETERTNFVYYNNGITVICQGIGKDQHDTETGLRILPLVNPQIVNGCQTANSIKKVLEN